MTEREKKEKYKKALSLEITRLENSIESLREMIEDGKDVTNNIGKLTYYKGLLTAYDVSKSLFTDIFEG